MKKSDDDKLAAVACVRVDARLRKAAEDDDKLVASAVVAAAASGPVLSSTAT
jgi:hypothetical protein